eukprot:Sdes_comp24137_c0_seq1m22172
MSHYSEDFEEEQSGNVSQASSQHGSIDKLKIIHESIKNSKMNSSEDDYTSASEHASDDSNPPTPQSSLPYVSKLHSLNDKLTKKISEFKEAIVQESKALVLVPPKVNKRHRKEKTKIYTEVEVEQVKSLTNQLGEKDLLIEKLTEENKTL